MVIFYKLLTVVDGVALNAGGGMSNAFFPSESATTFRPPTFAAFKPRRCIRDSIQALLVPVDRCLEKLRVPVRLINDASGRLVVGGACLCDSATAPRHRHRSYTARDYYNSCVSSAPPRPPPIVKIARENRPAFQP